ncbi:MAG: SPFH domain-containing protein [Bacteroidales bacterium]|nr:SPFH domain-containing protein [Bacteroides sp.]MCM1198826.1 SPFH domain-containing protein [Clostridium sp.]MCM1501252.1 SPFH domain-containing protein [Bacteroidales bacterium]
MKKNIIKYAAVIVMAAAIMGCERIDAGCEGIRVNLYGNNKGVDQVNLVTGMVWYNPLTTAVYEYPMYVQTVDYPPFAINAKDGSKFVVDPTININPVAGKSPEIFKKYRKPLEDVMQDVLYTHIKNAYRIKLNNYTTDELVSKREEFEKTTEEYLREVLLKENFELGEMTSGLKYPETLEATITQKNEAVQKAQKAANELEIVKAEAEKKIVAARAEYEANLLKTKALTPQILEQMWIDKWNGEVPTVITGSNTSTFLDLGQLRKAKN